MRASRSLWLAALTLGALGLAACAADEAGGAEPSTPSVTEASTAAVAVSATEPVDPSAPSTVGGVGNLPGVLPTAPIEEIAATTTLPPPEEEVGTIANGNRVLMLGDSVLASTARRYGNNMCKVLTPLGWQVELEAEVSRGIDFGQKVQKELDDQPWDVGLIFLGNNYNGDQEDFYRRYNDVIVKFGDIPVVVTTVTESNNDQALVNSIIRALAEAHPNVTVLDWAKISTYGGVVAENDSIGVHLSDQGRQVLAEAVGHVLGVAPAQPGKCLDSRHHDDSAGSVNGTPGTSGTGNGGKPTGTTVKPTSTTAKPTSSTAPASTSPPQTDPPQTNPPATSPPTAPPTNPPPTIPPP